MIKTKRRFADYVGQEVVDIKLCKLSLIDKSPIFLCSQRGSIKISLLLRLATVLMIFAWSFRLLWRDQTREIEDQFLSSLGGFGWVIKGVLLVFIVLSLYLEIKRQSKKEKIIAAAFLMIAFLIGLGAIVLKQNIYSEEFAIYVDSNFLQFVELG